MWWHSKAGVDDGGDGDSDENPLIEQGKMRKEMTMTKEQPKFKIKQEKDRLKTIRFKPTRCTSRSADSDCTTQLLGPRSFHQLCSERHLHSHSSTFE